MKAAEQGSHITGDTGKVVEDERELEGSISSDEAEQCPWSKGALLFAMARTKREARVNDKDTQQFAGPE